MNCLPYAARVIADTYITDRLRDVLESSECPLQLHTPWIAAMLNIAREWDLQITCPANGQRHSIVLCGPIQDAINTIVLDRVIDDDHPEDTEIWRWLTDVCPIDDLASPTRIALFCELADVLWAAYRKWHMEE